MPVAVSVVRLPARIVRRLACMAAAMMLMTSLQGCRSTDGAEDPVLGLRASAVMPGPADGLVMG